MKLIGPLLYLLTFSSSRLEYPFINIERIWMRSSFGNQTRTSNFEHSLTWKSADMNIAFRFISWPWKKYFIQQTLPTKSFSNDFFSQRTFWCNCWKRVLKFKLRMVIAKLCRFYPLRNVRIAMIEISSKKNYHKVLPIKIVKMKYLANFGEFWQWKWPKSVFQIFLMG